MTLKTGDIFHIFHPLKKPTQQHLTPVNLMEKTAVTCVAWLPRGIYNGRLDGGQEPMGGW